MIQNTSDWNKFLWTQSLLITYCGTFVENMTTRQATYLSIGQDLYITNSLNSTITCALENNLGCQFRWSVSMLIFSSLTLLSLSTWESRVRTVQGVGTMLAGNPVELWWNSSTDWYCASVSIILHCQFCHLTGNVVHITSITQASR